MDRGGLRRRGGGRPRLGRGDSDFGPSYEHEEYEPEQDFIEDDMGPSRHSTRGGPPGRGGAGHYGMSDDMDDEMDMHPRGGHDRHRHASTDRDEVDYKMQLAILNQSNKEALRRHGGMRSGESPPPTHFLVPHPRNYQGRSGADQSRFMPPSTMLSGSRPPPHPSHVGGGGPRGPRGESLVEYIDAEEHLNRERYGGEHGHRGGGGPPRGQSGRYGITDEDEDLGDESDYPPSSSRRPHRGSAGGRRGHRLD